MKKKLAMLLIMASVTVSLTGCGPTRAVLNDQAEENEMEASEEEEESDEKEDTKANSSDVHFGNDFDEDDLDYQYLFAETLMSDSTENPDTGKMEKQSLTIAIPQDDYPMISRDYGYSEKMGVRVRVELNPYLQYQFEDYTVEENLKAYLDNAFDEFYSVDYKDMDISDIESDDEMATATVDYIKYDDYDDTYTVYQETYMLYDFAPNKMALVIVRICADDTTGKTGALLDEVNDFYGCDIEWDDDAAETRLAKFLKNTDTDILQVSTGWIIFDLPKGWSEDWKNNDNYRQELYAPGGDMFKAGCYISVGRDWQEYGNEVDVASIAGDEESLEILRTMMARAIELDEKDISVSDYGMTVMGRAIEFTYTITESGVTYEEHRWWVSDDDYIYEIVAGQINDDSVEDAISIAEGILENGQVSK